MAIGFEAFDLAGRVTIEVGDSDQVLLRISNQAKTTDTNLTKLEKQAEKTANALKRIGGTSGGQTSQNLFANVSRQQQQAVTASKSIGLSINQGLAQGIAGGARHSQSAIAGVVTSLINRAKSLLGIRSPSMVFAGIGNFMVRGLAQGVSGSTGIAESSVSGLFTAITLSAQAAAQQVIQAVKIAADFERTRLALTAIGRSAAGARQELAELLAISRQTPGLNLEAAEQGAIRLRSVGFEAKETQAILVGLSKLKILSGASKQDLEGVVYNLSQIRSIGRLTGDELRETLGRLPASAQVFQKAFGTISTEKIKELNLSSDEFFRRFTEALKEVPQVAGGAQDAWDKFTDQITVTQRLFGEPVLAPLTDTLHTFTDILRSNQDVVKEWGQDMAALVASTNLFVGALRKLPPGEKPKPPSPVGGAFFGASIGGFPIGTLIEGFLATGQAQARGQRLRAAQKENPFGVISKVLTKIKPVFDEQRKDEGDEQVRNYKLTLDRLEKERQQDLTRVENYYAEQANLASAGLRLTTEQELAYQKTVSRIKGEESRKRLDILAAEISKTKAENEALIKSYTNTEDQAKRRRDLGLEIAGKEAEYEKEKIKTQGEQIARQNQILELEHRIADAARQAAIEFNDIEIQRFGQQLESQVFDIERAIDLQITTIEDGYEALVTANFTAFEKIYDLTYQNYAKQLADTSLTAEQRVNIEKRMYLELEGLTDAHNRKVLELDNRRYREQINRLESFSRRQQELFESQANVFSGIGGFFQPEAFSRRSFEEFQKAFLGVDLQKQVDALKEQRKQVFKDLQQLKSTATSAIEFQGTENFYDKLGIDLDKAEQGLSKFADAAKGTEGEIGRLGIALTTTTGAFENFDKIAEKALFAQQKNELEAFNAQLDFANEKLRVLNTQRESQLTREANILRGKVGSLEKTAVGTLEKTELDGLRIDLEAAEKALAEFKAGAGKTEEILNAENAIRVLSNSFKGLASKQAQERIDLFSRSIAGLKQSLIDLQTGDTATRNRLQDIFTKDLLEEQIGQYTEIEAIKFRLANTPLINAQEVEIAQLQEIIRLRGEEQARAEVKAIRGNRGVILDRLAIEQEQQATLANKARVAQLEADQAAALERVNGLQDEQTQKLKILQEYGERFAQAEKDFQEKLEKIQSGDAVTRRAADRLDAQENSLFGGSIFGGIRDDLGLGSVDDAIFGSMDEEEARMVARGEIYKDFGNTVVGVFGAMASAAQSVLSTFILTGEGGADAIKQLVAQTIASVAVESGVKAIFQLAEGFAALARFDPVSAAGHFAAAKLYGSVALGAGAVGIGIGLAGGLSGKGKGNAQQQQNQPDYYTAPPTQQQLQPPPITPQQVQRTSEGNVWVQHQRVLEMLANEVHRLGAVSPGQVLITGAKEQPGFIGKQNHEDLKRGYVSPTDMRRTLGTG